MSALTNESTAIVIALPRLGPNDDEARLVSWLAKAGDKVAAGQAICEVETTTAGAEVTSPRAGYLSPLVEVDSTVPVNAALAIVSTDQTIDRAAILAAHRSPPEQEEGPASPAGAASPRQATKKAELMARRHRINLDMVPPSQPDGVIRENDVERYRASGPAEASTRTRIDTFASVSRILVLGSVLGGGAAIIVDILLRSDRDLPVAILDRNASTHGTYVLGVPVEGSSEIANVERLYEAGRFDAAIIAFNRNLKERAAVFEELERARIPIANAIDAKAEIRSEARIGRGNVIAAWSYIGAEARLGDNNFLSSRTTIEHHCIVGSHCGFGPSVSLSGRVKVGNQVRFGTMIAVEPDVTIGDRAVIASSCVLTTDVAADSLVKAVVSHRTTAFPVN